MTYFALLSYIRINGVKYLFFHDISLRVGLYNYPVAITQRPMKNILPFCERPMQLIKQSVGSDGINNGLEVLLGLGGLGISD